MATRQIKPKSPDSFELYWTYFGYHDDSPELRRLRMRQVNLVGPGGLVSMEDGEAGRLVQLGVAGGGSDHSLIAMGGSGPIVDQEHRLHRGAGTRVLALLLPFDGLPADRRQHVATTATAPIRVTPPIVAKPSDSG